jgi:hypothetical protein
MKRVFPNPTVDLVQEKCREFDQDLETRLTEDTVRLLWETFPQNDKLPHVVLKVLVLNRLYNTRINDVDVTPLAKHIATSGVDSLLMNRSLLAVETICECPGLKRYFSFATKFCSLHYPTAYPIYDWNVNECLWSYQQEDKFADPTFHRQDLSRYATFYRVMSAFRSFYGLDRFSFKEIDKFLWLQGAPWRRRTPRHSKRPSHVHRTHRPHHRRILRPILPTAIRAIIPTGVRQ